MNAIAKALFAALMIEVSKKDPKAGKHVKVGDVTIHCPVLESIEQPFVRQMDDKGVEVTDEGLPVYVDAQHNWLQNAILAQVKAQARNKLVSGTATLKDGATIATDWASLMEGGQGGNNGDALAAIREVKALFTAHVATIGKSQKAQETLVTLFKNKDSLALQTAEVKSKMEGYLSAFVDTLTEAQVTRYGKYLENLSTACQESIEAEDF